MSVYLSNPRDRAFPFTSIESPLLSIFNYCHCVLVEDKTIMLEIQKKELRSPLCALFPF